MSLFRVEPEPGLICAACPAPGRVQGGPARLDLVIKDELIVEIKAGEKLIALHEAQVLTYLRLSGHKVGLLLNFNSVRLKDGLRRFVL